MSEHGFEQEEPREQLKIGDVHLDQDGLRWTITQVEPELKKVPADPPMHTEAMNHWILQPQGEKTNWLRVTEKGYQSIILEEVGYVASEHKYSGLTMLRGTFPSLWQAQEAFE